MVTKNRDLALEAEAETNRKNHDSVRFDSTEYGTGSVRFAPLFLGSNSIRFGSTCVVESEIRFGPVRLLFKRVRFGSIRLNSTFSWNKISVHFNWISNRLRLRSREKEPLWIRFRGYVLRDQSRIESIHQNIGEVVRSTQFKCYILFYVSRLNWGK
jgi:hypothetical protein